MMMACGWGSIAEQRQGGERGRSGVGAVAVGGLFDWLDPES